MCSVASQFCSAHTVGEKRLPPNQTEEELISFYEKNQIKPIKFDLKGNYGVSVVWSDGHYADIFPYDILKKIALEYK